MFLTVSKKISNKLQYIIYKIVDKSTSCLQQYDVTPSATVDKLDLEVSNIINLGYYLLK